MRQIAKPILSDYDKKVGKRCEAQSETKLPCVFRINHEGEHVGAITDEKNARTWWAWS